jgi:hypothetical protein
LKLRFRRGYAKRVYERGGVRITRCFTCDEHEPKGIHFPFVIYSIAARRVERFERTKDNCKTFGFA